MNRSSGVFKPLAALIGLWLCVLTPASGYPLPDFGAIPQEFALLDFKLRPDQAEEIRRLLEHLVAKKGEQLTAKDNVLAGLQRACDDGPDALIALLGSSDSTLLEIALVGLSIQFGPSGSAAVPQVTQIVRQSRYEDRIRQMAAHSLIRIGYRIPNLDTSLLQLLKEIPANEFSLRAALVEGLGQLGRPAIAALPTLRSELLSASAKVQYQAFLSIAHIAAPTGQVRLDDLPAQRSLRDLSPEDLVNLVDRARADAKSATNLWKALVREADETAPKYLRSFALETIRRVHWPEQRTVEMIIECLGDPDIDLSSLGADALAELGKDFVEFVPTLSEGLSHPSTTVRTAVSTCLAKFGPRAAPATLPLAAAVRACNERTPEAEIESYLIAIRSIGPAAAPAGESLLTLFPEQADLFKNRQKFFLHHIRGFALITLSEIGVPSAALPFIMDNLANADRNMPYPYAAAARAAGSMGPAARVAVPYLLRALRSELRDDYITFETLRGHRSSNGEYTTSQIEAVRALARMGSAAREALPDLEKLANQPSIPRGNSNRLHRVPNINEEAQAAIQAIRR